mmetsp:Transcript_36168/g.87297  ORF Transcript_36168/g.87297 Transcript_36168/m.87297 type:complete len:271 (-) Transcript_36168:1511-2323(-)
MDSRGTPPLPPGPRAARQGLEEDCDAHQVPDRRADSHPRPEILPEACQGAPERRGDRHARGRRGRSRGDFGGRRHPRRHGRGRRHHRHSHSRGRGRTTRRDHEDDRACHLCPSPSFGEHEPRTRCHQRRRGAGPSWYCRGRASTGREGRTQAQERRARGRNQAPRHRKRCQVCREGGQEHQAPEDGPDQQEGGPGAHRCGLGLRSCCWGTSLRFSPCGCVICSRACQRRISGAQSSPIGVQHPRSLRHLDHGHAAPSGARTRHCGGSGPG